MADEPKNDAGQPKYTRVMKNGRLTVKRNTTVAEDLRDIVHHFSGGKSVLQHSGESYDDIVDNADRGDLSSMAAKIRKRKAAQ